MAIENRVSQKVSPEDQTKIDEALKTIRSVLKPYLLTISTAERHQLPKMSDRSVPFVNKVLDYSQAHPEFSPSYLDVEELRKDLDLFDVLTSLNQRLTELSEELIDTTIVAGSEAYVAALAYYNAVKQGTKQNVPNAKTIFDDLKIRFESNGPKASKTVA